MPIHPKKDLIILVFENTREQKKSKQKKNQIKQEKEEDNRSSNFVWCT